VLMQRPLGAGTTRPPGPGLEGAHA